VKVYVIDTVEIPIVLVPQGQQRGEKGELIALAVGLERFSNNYKVLCVADSDSDAILNRFVDSSFLAYTDFPSIEAYTFTARVLGQFLTLVLGVDDDVAVVMAELQPALRELFLFYSACRSLGWEPHRLDIRGSYVRKKGQLIFDAMTYRRNVLNAMGRHDDEPLVAEAIERLRPHLAEDPRASVDGHDLVRLLGIRFERHAQRRGLREFEALWSALSACLRKADIENETLFGIVSVFCD
jgi:hypothetical protein